MNLLYSITLTFFTVSEMAVICPSDLSIYGVYTYDLRKVIGILPDDEADFREANSEMDVVTYTCSPEPGSILPLGDTTVTCNATFVYWTSAQCEYNVTSECKYLCHTVSLIK